MVDITGLGDQLWADVECNARLKGKDFSYLIFLTGEVAIAPRDVDHCWMNRCVLRPFVERMKSEKNCTVPYKPQLEVELSKLAAKMMGVETVEELSEETMSQVYLCITSIKRLLQVIRGKFLRPNVPRDRCVKNMQHVFHQGKLPFTNDSGILNVHHRKLFNQHYIDKSYPLKDQRMQEMIEWFGDKVTQACFDLIPFVRHHLPTCQDFYLQETLTLEPGAGDGSDHDEPKPSSKASKPGLDEGRTRETPVPKPETAPNPFASLTGHELQQRIDDMKERQLEREKLRNAENEGIDATTMSDDALQKRIDEIQAAPMAEEVVPPEDSPQNSDVEIIDSSGEEGLPHRPCAWMDSQKLADRIQELYSKLPGPHHLLCHPGPSKASASQVDGEFSSQARPWKRRHVQEIVFGGSFAVFVGLGISPYYIVEFSSNIISKIHYPVMYTGDEDETQPYEALDASAPQPKTEVGNLHRTILKVLEVFGFPGLPKAHVLGWEIKVLTRTQQLKLKAKKKDENKKGKGPRGKGDKKQGTKKCKGKGTAKGKGKGGKGKGAKAKKETNQDKDAKAKKGTNQDKDAKAKKETNQVTASAKTTKHKATNVPQTEASEAHDTATATSIATSKKHLDSPGKGMKGPTRRRKVLKHATKKAQQAKQAKTPVKKNAKNSGKNESARKHPEKAGYASTFASILNQSSMHHSLPLFVFSSW